MKKEKDNFYHYHNIDNSMNNKVPLLNLEQIEELTNMVRSIQLENNKKLETILSQTVEIEQTTILTLYNLAVEEWKKKQTVIDNLCHFTLTMMSTVEMLWLQQHDQQDKLSSAEVYIEHLNNNIYQLGDENQCYKQKIKEAQVKISAVIEEKQRIEELYRSQSCIAFNQYQNQPLKTLNKHCSACSQLHVKSQEQNIEKLHKSQKFIEEKLQQLSEALQQKKLIEDQYNQLKEEHDLTRMQLELAEMAIKDALVYKHSYLSIISNANDIQSSKSQSIFENSKVYDTEGIIEDIKNLNSHILASQIPENLQMENLFRQNVLPENNQFQSKNDLSLIKLGKQQKRTTHESPFKKKEENMQQPELQLKEQELIEEMENLNKKYSNKTQRIHQDKFAKPKMLKNQSNFIKYNQDEPLRNVKSMKLISSSTKDIKSSKHKEQEQSQSKLGKLYTLISNKLVTNRIKKR